MKSDIDVLRGALLWARNHINAGDPAVKDAIVTRLDAVIADYKPRVGDLLAFQKTYPLGGSER